MTALTASTTRSRCPGWPRSTTTSTWTATTRPCRANGNRPELHGQIEPRAGNSPGPRLNRRTADYFDRDFAALFRLRVAAAFLAEAERSAAVRDADAAPPFLPPFLLEAWDSALPRPLPDFLPPPDSLLTVAQARDL